MRLRGVFAALAAFTTLAAPAAAHADPGDKVDWARVLVELDVLARRGVEVFDAQRCAEVLRGNGSSGCYVENVRRERALDPNMQNAGNAWFGVAPRVSLVARDWGAAFKVAGDRLALVDALRLTSSTRMVMTRVRLSDRRFTPFVQLGLGQWRMDPYLLPLAPRNPEIAAQIGGGFEVALLRNWQIAAETSATVIYRDDVPPVDAAVPRMWSTTLASRIEW
ncbi:MAG: hypothetical protein JST00_13960 [Deltaproteobacteria bacterium]|nr:hypothetical protein [Deltaproteobacteria bacterium]